MKKFAILFLLITISHRASSVESYGSIKGCGRYKVGGIIRKHPKDTLRLIVNEFSNSQFQFKPATGELSNFAGYIDIPIELEVDIQKLDGTRGEVLNPSRIKPIVPNPLRPTLQSGFILIEEKKCEGK